MFLKRLEIYGFKSFADKTVLDFTSGVTALVGPNGCGKSNVVDAIRWALGEQSAKSLRGSEMVDLIFNGTATRRPLGYAQVSLVFDNVVRHLPVDAEEVAITRRLYRTGESEYMINGQPCRLRDIRELFMDTGVGVGAYSIIEQGRIDALLQASAKERRGIFEEAAGIAKYHSRKAAALRKLDRVDQNLLRVGDVIAEVERQLRSVVRQAARARRYQELAAQLAEVRLNVLALDYRALAETLAGTRAELSGVEDQAGAAAAESGRLEAALAVAQLRADELEASSQKAEQQRAEDRARLARVEAEIAGAESRVRQFAEEARRARGEAQELAARAAAAENEETQARGQVAAAEAEAAGLSGRLAEAESAATTGAAHAARLSEQVESRKSEAMEVVRRRAGIESEISQLLAEKRHIETGLSRVGQAAAMLGERLTAARTELQHGQARVTELATRRAVVEAELIRVRGEEDAATAELARVESAASDMSAELGARGSRLHLLSEHEARHEGLSSGVRGVLSAMNAGSAPAGIRGLVADLVKVPERLEIAIETALGNKVQNVVADSTQAAREAVELLKRDRLGRATFLPLDRVRPGHFHPGPATLAESGVIGRAADLVSFSDEYRSVFEYLLGSTVVVEDLDSAMRIANNGARDGLVVTIEGEIFYPSGAITGGAFRVRTPGIISRRNEIARLEEDICDLQADVADLAGRREALSAQRNGARRRSDELTGENNALRAAELRLREGLEIVGREASRVEEERSLTLAEAAELTRRNGEADVRLEEFRRRGADLSGEETALQDGIRGLVADLEAAEKRRGELREQLTALRIAAAQLDEKRSSLTARAESAARLLVERRAEAQARAQAAAEAEAGCVRERQGIEDLRRRQDEAVRNAQAAELAGSELAELRAGLRGEIERVQSAERICRGEQARLNARAGELRLSERENSLRLEALADRARAAGDERLAERAATLDPATLDSETLHRQLREGDEKLARMGPVNLAAIGEEDALRARSTELTAQQADLEESRRLLRDAIARINRISRERFTATFDEVRRHFGETYRKLFGGGKADIYLEEGQDVLEAGIEVVARPPGKELRKMSLLSGGERTLTTISLLFAIFKAKPSPFCVLDEVDAPLDESNIDRFMLVLREFLDHSQFLIITHNRRTMATADMIYGVTMQESGVSKRIAVKFEEVGEDLAVA
jgi:chromosome segregation protein